MGMHSIHQNVVYSTDEAIGTFYSSRKLWDSFVRTNGPILCTITRKGSYRAFTETYTAKHVKHLLVLDYLSQVMLGEQGTIFHCLN